MRHCLLLIAVLVSCGAAAPSTHGDSFKITANNKGVHFEMWNVSASGQSVVYDAKSGDLVLEGAANSPAALSRSGGSDEIRARRIIFSTNTGKTKVEGIEFLNIKH
jgi:lipopolysaccharide export system protein LptA